jgi:hypothetical protein
MAVPANLMQTPSARQGVAGGAQVEMHVSVNGEQVSQERHVEVQWPVAGSHVSQGPHFSG